MLAEEGHALMPAQSKKRAAPEANGAEANGTAAAAGAAAGAASSEQPAKKKKKVGPAM